ncbi:MAG TPA: glycoside hydrolase family 125 protein [Ktedonobacteraceae bacterium]
MSLIEATATTIPLLAVPNKKPVDLGCGRLSASVSADGQILSINTYHPQVGFVTLTPIEQFPDTQFYQPAFVRDYRRRLIDLAEQTGQGFGLRVWGEIQQPTLQLLEKSVPLVRYHVGTLEVTSLFLAGESENSGHLIHQVEISNTGETTAIFPYEFGGTWSLNRCSYAELTEDGPIPMPPPENALEVRENRLSLVNGHLPARADVFLFDNGRPLLLSPARKTAAEPVSYTHRGEIPLKKGERRRLSLVYVLGSSAEEPPPIAASQAEKWSYKAQAALFHWKSWADDTAAFIVQRNIDYIFSCCAIPVTEEHVCVITDHQLLPLSWNRDAYYMIRLLLVAEQQRERVVEASWHTVWREKIQQVSRGHLLWLFETAQRPHRYWGRAYLATGYCKDEVLELDEQCYPLLELCDYCKRFGDESLFRRVSSQVNEILDMLLEHKAEQMWLFRTIETPADDLVSYPYHFSSQVVLWWTLKQLASIQERMPFTTHDLAAWAENVRQACLTAFRTEWEGKAVFAYLTDLQGNYQLYYDANDLPTIYAPVWEFCHPHDETWNQTLQFGLSTSNTGGFYPGVFGGLGSVHTSHPWPLGDVQELLYAQMLGDQERWQRVWQKLRQIVQWDGLFSEAINEATGQVESRHWFSWPGAFLSTVLLGLGNRP